MIKVNTLKYKVIYTQNHHKEILLAVRGVKPQT